jgi:O-6-methylguanine DNA methyltransferase
MSRRKSIRPAGEAGRPVDDLARDLAGLRATAPRNVAVDALVEVGLRDAYAQVESAIGPLFVAWNGLGLTAVTLAGDPASFERDHAARTGRAVSRAPEPPRRLRQGIEARLSGRRRAAVPLDWRGRSEFERSVWAKTAEIPAGEVRPYGWVAAEIGRPKAVRAVGTALGHNPVPLVVPCHRVVRGDGSIGQYSLGGPEVKRRILESEQVDLDELAGLAASGTRLIGSDTTRIVCFPTCRHARRIGPSHRVRFRDLGAARAAGYRPCRDCRPVAAGAAAGAAA